MRTQQFFYEATPGEGGPQPTLEELMNNEPLPVEGLNEDGTVKEGYQKNDDGTITKVEAPKPDEVEGVDAEGNILEGYQRNTDGTVTKIEAPNPKEGEGNEDPLETEPEEFFKAVEAITGETLDVPIEYGDVDPLSPEGVAKRELAIREDAALKFEQYLKEKDPRGFAYLSHREAGLPDEDFFGAPSFTLPTEAELKADVDLQSKLIKQDLIAKDIPEEVAESVVAKYIKDNVLEKKALETFAKQQEAEQEYLDKLEELKQKDKEEFDSKVNSITSAVAKVINTGDVRFVIPETKKAEFNNFVKNNIRYDDGNFYLVSPLKEDNVKEVLEAQLFQFLKGNLSALIAKQAKSETVQRLRSVIDKNKSKGFGGQSGGAGAKDVLPLGDL